MKIRPQMQGEGTWGHRNSQIFQRGKASPFDPRCHCVDVAGCLLWGIRARQLVLFFTIRQVLDCGQAGMWYCEFKIRCLHFRINSVTIESFSHSHKRLKYIYFHPDGCAPHGGSWRHLPKTIPKTWRRHRGETIQRPIFLYLLTRDSFFVLRKRVRVRKCFEITSKLFKVSNSKKIFLTYFLFVSLRVF